MQYYFGFRQVIPRPPGKWIAVGPYDSYDQAKVARENAKAADAQVSTPFLADSKEEAQAKCDDGKVF